MGTFAFDATGAWIAFPAAGDHQGIHVVATAGGTPPRRLTEALDQFPLFTNEGTLLFSRNDAEGILRLHEIDPTGGAVSLASADDVVAYTVNRKTGEILVLPSHKTAATWWNRKTNARRPGPDLTVSGEGASYFSFSPSGRYLVIAVAQRVYRRDLEPRPSRRAHRHPPRRPTDRRPRRHRQRRRPRPRDPLVRRAPRDHPAAPVSEQEWRCDRGGRTPWARVSSRAHRGRGRRASRGTLPAARPPSADTPTRALGSQPGPDLLRWRNHPCQPLERRRPRCRPRRRARRNHAALNVGDLADPQK